MRHLKILYPAFLCQPHELLQLFKPKRIPVPVLLYVNQLNGHALFSHLRIQRRRKQRRQKHRETMFHRASDKRAKFFVIGVRKKRQAVIFRYAVAMQPVSTDEIDVRKFFFQNAQTIIRLRNRQPLPIENGKPEPVFSRRQAGEYDIERLPAPHFAVIPEGETGASKSGIMQGALSKT